MKTLYLFDLDLTLINTNYRPTIPLYDFTKLVEQQTAAGDLFGLISDTPFESLQRWAMQFKFTGPIVSEKGALFSESPGNHQLIRPQIIDWNLVKESIKEGLRNSIDGLAVIEKYYLDLLTGQSDTTIESGPLVIINPFRRYSFGLHVCQSNGSSINLNKDLFSRIVEIIDRILKDLKIIRLLDIDINPLYSVIILADANIQKCDAVPTLRERYPEHRLVAVGDGTSDAVLKGHVDQLCAVANAADELIRVADLVSQGEITAGALEILQHFSKKE